jgi:hypothetical protein
MLLGGILKNKRHLILSLFDIIMELPITEKEFEKILKLLEKSDEKQLYAKLWTFNFNKNKDKMWNK